MRARPGSRDRPRPRPSAGCRRRHHHRLRRRPCRCLSRRRGRLWPRLAGRSARPLGRRCGAYAQAAAPEPDRCRREPRQRRLAGQVAPRGSREGAAAHRYVQGPARPRQCTHARAAREDGHRPSPEPSWPSLRKEAGCELPIASTRTCGAAARPLAPSHIYVHALLCLFVAHDLLGREAAGAQLVILSSSLVCDRGAAFRRRKKPTLFCTVVQWLLVLHRSNL